MTQVRRVAIISVHGSPLGAIGGKDTGGMNVYVGELGGELAARGIEVDLFTRWNDPAAKQIVEMAPGFRIVHVKAGEIAPVEKNELPDHLPEFLNTMREFVGRQGLEYDVVHSHYWLSAWVAEKAARSWDIPWVAMYHTLGRIKKHHRVGEKESPQRIEIERRTLAAADAVVSASDAERGQISRLYGVPLQKIVGIPCGVDLEQFRPLEDGALRKKLKVGPEDPVILFVGRIEPLKGIDTLLQAVAAIEERDSLQVWIVGGDKRSAPQRRRLLDLSQELGIADVVRFLGSVPHAQLPEYYSAADVCVVPSYYESFGMVALESLACGTPVIASRVGGLQTTVRDGENGYLVSWRCPEPFAEKIEVLLGNPGLRRSFSQAARAGVAPFSWKVVTDQTVELYDSLIAGRASSSGELAGAATPHAS